MKKNDSAVLIRKLPYPYRGSLSISNDIEFFAFDFFEDLMCFLSTDKETSLGKGLGLEITSSLFFYTVNNYTFSYFKGCEFNSPLSEDALRLNDYLQSGWIDTNHAYGDFDGVGGFTRNYALGCYEVLSNLEVNLPIFTNHGGIENIQNVGIDANYHCGDIINHSAYHVDLMQENGVKFLWTDSLIVAKYDYPQLSIKRRIRNLFEKQKIVIPETEKILTDLTLQDNSAFTGFKRFRSTGLNAPNFSSLNYQIQQIDWQALYQNHGTIILYQHLGVLYRANGKCISASVDALQARPEVYLAPLYFLKSEAEQGHLWVAGLAKMLNYLKMLEDVTINFDKTEERYMIIYPETIGDPQFFFQGLTFYIDPQKPTVLYYNQEQIKVVYNGPDETGNYSVTVPLQKIKEIW